MHIMVLWSCHTCSSNQGTGHLRNDCLLLSGCSPQVVGSQGLLAHDRYGFAMLHLLHAWFPAIVFGLTLAVCDNNRSVQ